MFFDNWTDLARIALSTFVTYALIIVILRVGGKRTLAKLNAFDFVVTVALGSLLAAAILTKSVALADAAVAIGGLALLQFIVTWLSCRSRSFAKLLRSEPRLLLCDGKFHEAALSRERVTRDEVEAAIRKDGHGKVEEVTAVVLESDGTLSVICEGRAADCTALRSVLGPDESGE